MSVPTPLLPYFELGVRGRRFLETKGARMTFGLQEFATPFVGVGFGV